MDNRKYDCDIVQDLLPLYQDGICSDSSKKMIEEHLTECADCSYKANLLKNTRIDEKIEKERDTILSAHAKKERKVTYTVGVITAGILMIPVIVCLICNLAIGHALDWFFIVLASLLMLASVTVVPMLVQEKRMLWTLITFTGSLVLLLLVVCIYVRGDWFFVAAVPGIFGLSIFFMPYIICQIPLPKAFQNKKALLVMIWDTLWLFAVIVVSGIYVNGGNYYWSVGLITTAYCLLLPWAIFIVVRYVKTHPFIKAGIVVLIAGMFTAFANDSIRVIVEGVVKITIFHADFTIPVSEWTDTLWNANVSAIILLVALPIGIVCIISGILLQKKEQE